MPRRGLSLIMNGDGWRMPTGRGSWCTVRASLCLLALHLLVAPALAAPESPPAAQQAAPRGFHPFILRALKIDGGDLTREQVMPVVEPWLNQRVDYPALQSIAAGIARVA